MFEWLEIIIYSVIALIVGLLVAEIIKEKFYK